MSRSGQQMLRQLKMIAEIKKGNFPNTQTFARLFAEFEGEEGQPMRCSNRTILRDIQQLQQQYGAPIEYDNCNKGYYLRHPNWEFKYPVFQEDFLSMSILGSRLAADIVPDPLKSGIDRAVTQTLANNSAEFFDSAMLDSMLCASGMKSSIDATVFAALFHAWRRKQAVFLKYRDTRGKISEQEFEPHIIAFHKGLWYAKGYIYNSKTIKIYACQRMVELRRSGHGFEIDKELLQDTKKNGLFIYPRLSGIKLHCDASIAFYIHEQQKIFKSKIEPQDDGSLILSLNPSVEHDVVRWILAEAGRIQVLEPKALREKIAEAGREITRKNS